MNDYEYTFNQDVREKKNIAHSAFHKRGGAKSRKVTLPNEHISRKEWESMNGEVKTISMNRPMTWAEFRALDKDLQEKYLNCLKDGYSVTMKMIATMMGTTHGALSGYISRYKLNVKFPRVGYRKYLPEDKREAWAKFCEGEPKIEAAVDVELEEAPSLCDPMTYSTFITLLPAKQKDYLKYIRGAFGVGITLIAQMMGVDRETLYGYCVEHGLDYILKGKIKPTKEQQKSWMNFCNIQEEIIEEPKPIEEETVDSSDLSLVLTNFDLVFDGPVVLQDVFTYLKKMTEKDVLNGKLRIVFEG